MSEQNAGPSPEGVMHGPYPKTEAHPYDQTNGVYAAIEEAERTGQIDSKNARDLEDNAGSLALEEHDEWLQIESEKESEQALEEYRKESEQEEEKYLSGEDLEEREHGKKHEMY